MTFFAQADQVPEVQRRVAEEVLPRFSEIPEFLGFVIMQSDGRRSEIVAMSFWDEGLEGSEAISEEFRDEIERATGAAPTQKEFTVLTMAMPAATGAPPSDLPPGDDHAERCPRGHRLANAVRSTSEPPTRVFCPTCNSDYRRQPDGTFVDHRPAS